MVRFLASAIVSIAGMVMIFIGILAPLTPSEGMPSLETVFIYALLPLAMIAVSISYTTSTVFRLFLTVVLIGAIFVLGYIFLGLTSQ
ncbi:MAG: hypothetical protein AAGI89_14210 [Pseudomonadota bacterium]